MCAQSTVGQRYADGGRGGEGRPMQRVIVDSLRSMRIFKGMKSVSGEYIIKIGKVL